MAKFYGSWHKAIVHSLSDGMVVVMWQSEATISSLPVCDVKLLDASSDTSAELEGLEEKQQQKQQQSQEQQQAPFHQNWQLHVNQQQPKVSPVAQNKDWTPFASTGVVAPGLVGQAQLLVSDAARQAAPWTPAYTLGMSDHGDVHASDDTDTADSTPLVEVGVATADRAGVADPAGTSEDCTRAASSKEDEKDAVLVPGVGKMRRRDLDLLRAVHKGELDVEDDCVPDLSHLNPEQMQNLESFLDSPVDEATRNSVVDPTVREQVVLDTAAKAVVDPIVREKAVKVPAEPPKKGTDGEPPHWEQRLSPYRGALLRKQVQTSSATGTTSVRGPPPGLENVARIVPRTVKPIGSAL